jgi:hypothetical protein
VERHASLVAREEGVSFAKVWRLADRECIALTGGAGGEGLFGRCRRRGGAAVIEARRENPDGTQQEIARVAGVSRATVSGSNDQIVVTALLMRLWSRGERWISGPCHLVDAPGRLNRNLLHLVERISSERLRAAPAPA